ncbi:hypothetical protein RHGRI_038628 [Rhododendron griersonianum]|uniref:Gag protein n=1 Tax=Rhododendron griersonianum TaxID=479676 RepID=A0AAV6HNZ4_9ERIC|nr:hypothetical protein RHGRI_038628 [Rhododendron griersonianum]
MTPEIMKRYLRVSTACEIWVALSTAFYDGSDELQVYSLNRKAFTAKQRGKLLSVYYGELCEIFRELDHHDRVIMENTNDIAAYKKSIQRQQVHIFLAGLDEDFEQVRGEVLRKDSLPGLEECYALIRREAVRRATLNVESENIDSSVMVARNRPNLKLQEQPRLQQTQPQDQLRLNARSRGTTKQSYKCIHCDQIGHTKERCYELVGYPEWWDHSRDSKKRGSGQNATAALTEGKVDGDNEVAKRATALIATTGNNIGRDGGARRGRGDGKLEKGQIGEEGA